jgi:hypothetical protein
MLGVCLLTATRHYAKGIHYPLVVKELKTVAVFFYFSRSGKYFLIYQEEPG